MSILSQLFSKKITFSQGVGEAENWFTTLLSKAPAAIQADVATGLSDFKQAASDAVGLADSMMAPILATGTLAVEGIANTAISSVIGPILAQQITPALDSGITAVTNALHAEIDAVAAQIRARLASPSVPPVTSMLLSGNVSTGAE